MCPALSISLPALPHFILTMTVGGRYHYYPHLTGEKSENWGCLSNFCLNITASNWQAKIKTQVCLTEESILTPTFENMKPNWEQS